MNIFWFRRDLRLNDNHALFQALQQGPTLPIFIFDTEILQELPSNDKRVSFIYQQLLEIQQQLSSIGKSLKIYHGKPKNIFQQILQEFPVQAVFANQDFEPYSIQRDHEISLFLQSKGIMFYTFLDHVIFPPNEILQSHEKPYTIFTPYSKQWKRKIQSHTFPSYPSETLLQQIQNQQFAFPSIEELGFQSVALSQDFHFSPTILQTYAETRNFPSLPTTNLGVHLRFGTLSIRSIIKSSLKYETFLNELIWREFFIQILYHFPKVVHNSFKEKYDRILWRNHLQEFEAWKNGNTGYPIVDAGMRQLNKTGFMHNRVRMITASFLCKQLLIDWRWGESYFAEKLLDFELASNNGNWQWASGSGCDAAPYFRIFNPHIQTQKFDPQFLYIQKWVPEFQASTYPKPIIEAAFARERALETYKKYVI